MVTNLLRCSGDKTARKASVCAVRSRWNARRFSVACSNSSLTRAESACGLATSSQALPISGSTCWRISSTRLRIELQFGRHLLVALVRGGTARGRLQPGPQRAGDKEQVEGDRYGDEGDQQVPSRRPRGRPSTRGRRAHVCAPSVKSRRKPLDGSSSSRRKPSSLGEPFRVSAIETSSPSEK